MLLSSSLAATIEQLNTSQNLSTANVPLKLTHARAGRTLKRGNAHLVQREAVQKWGTKRKIMGIGSMAQKNFSCLLVEGSNSVVSST